MYRSIEVTALLAPGSYGVGWSSAPAGELGARACTGTTTEAEWTHLAPGGQATPSIEMSPKQERRLHELRERSGLSVARSLGSAVTANLTGRAL